MEIPWKTRITVSLISYVMDVACHSDDTIGRLLLSFLDFKSPPSPMPRNSVSSSDFTVHSSLRYRLFIPSPTSSSTSTSTSLLVLIFFHGRDFCSLSSASMFYDQLFYSFTSECTSIAIFVNYCLFSEHRLPSQYDDGLYVLKFLDGDCYALPSTTDLSKCFLVGDSAGGNIAHHVVVRVCKVEFQRVQVVGLVNIQPYFGGVKRTESEIRLVNVPIVSVARTDWCWKAF